MLSPDHPLLLSALEATGLAHRARVLAPHASVGIELAPTGEETGCRLGGEALLPEGASWPVHRWSRDEIARWPSHARDEVEKAIAEGQVLVEPEHVAMPLRFLGTIDLA